MKAKSELRSLIRNLKGQYSDEEKRRLSAAALKSLENDSHFLKASSVVAYYSLPDEVDTHDFLEKWRERKQLFLPKVEGQSLSLHPYLGMPFMQSGAFGIMEPSTPAVANADAMDLIIVPGMAFTADGKRLGRGKGFYDRFLAGLPPHKYIIGLAFPFQMVENMPTEPTDVQMNRVIFK